CEPAVVTGPRSEGEVEVPVVVLGGEAKEVGEPARAGVDVHRGGEHVGATEEELLRSVAVVRVDVDHGDRASEAREQFGGGDGRVVEVAGAAVERPGDVVAG